MSLDALLFTSLNSRGLWELLKYILLSLKIIIAFPTNTWFCLTRLSLKTLSKAEDDIIFLAVALGSVLPVVC